MSALTIPLNAQAAEPTQGKARMRRRAARQARDLVTVQGIRGGDPEAFRKLVSDYQKPLYWIAHDILLDRDEARDVVQETFLRVHAALDRYDAKRPFVNWIYRIARNLSIDLYRRRRRHATPVEDLTEVPEGGGEGTPAPLRAAGAGDVDAQVREVLATLPVDYRLALTLRELHGMSPREIARVTDCSYPTARWRLHRARALFRDAWTQRFAAARPEAAR